MPDDLDESALETRLFPGPATTQSTVALPDWPLAHTELRRKGVTLSLLWQEYKAEQLDGHQYSRFCERYRAWSQRVDVVMRQTHRAGEKLFVDYAGHTIAIVERDTGVIVKVPAWLNLSHAGTFTPY